MEEKTPLTILLPNSFRETASTIHIDRARDSDGGVSVDTLGRMLQKRQEDLNVDFRLSKI